MVGSITFLWFCGFWSVAVNTMYDMTWHDSSEKWHELMVLQRITRSSAARAEGRYTLPYCRVHGLCSWTVNTAHEHGCHFGRLCSRPCLRASVNTTRKYGPSCSQISANFHRLTNTSKSDLTMYRRPLLSMTSVSSSTLNWRWSHTSVELQPHASTNSHWVQCGASLDRKSQVV